MSTKLSFNSDFPEPEVDKCVRYKVNVDNSNGSKANICEINLLLKLL